jgi:hypothetical protein
MISLFFPNLPHTVLPALVMPSPLALAFMLDFAKVSYFLSLQGIMEFCRMSSKFLSC